MLEELSVQDGLRIIPLVSFPIAPNLGTRFFLRGVDL
jgi:hypothetical protein